jgi:hypothetical protein
MQDYSVALVKVPVCAKCACIGFDCTLYTVQYLISGNALAFCTKNKPCKTDLVFCELVRRWWEKLQRKCHFKDHVKQCESAIFKKQNLVIMYHDFLQPLQGFGPNL